VLLRFAARTCRLLIHLKNAYATDAWGIIRRFGYDSASERLQGSGIHSLENVMTLELNIHDHFDQLKVWLEPIPVRRSKNA
jgi:hypothetical protein